MIDRMISTTALLTIASFVAVWCQRTYISWLWGSGLIEVHAFVIYYSQRHSDHCRTQHRYESYDTIDVVTKCSSFSWNDQRRFKIISFNGCRLQASDDDDDGDYTVSSFNDDDSNTNRANDDDDDDSKNVVVVVPVSSFNPFQYDATSVRMNSDRIRTMSAIQKNNNTTNDDNPTIMTPAPSYTSSTRQSSMNNSNNNNNNNNNNRISLRALTMKQIMNEMINTVPDYDKIRTILHTHQDFLLELLEDDMVVQEQEDATNIDPNHNGTHRTQRYRAFQSNMQERIDMAQNPSVKQILMLYTEFVMSHL